MPSQTKYIEVITTKSIQEEYDSYIEGLYIRKSKPWLISKDTGILFINGDKRISFTWNEVKEDVRRLKIIKRTYYKSPYTLDEQIWQSFKNIGMDIWDSDGKGTYGISTIDGYSLDWDSFKELVENGQYEETPDRILILTEFDKLYENSEIQKLAKNEVINSEDTDQNWYEPIGCESITVQ